MDRALSIVKNSTLLVVISFIFTSNAFAQEASSNITVTNEQVAVVAEPSSAPEPVTSELSVKELVRRSWAASSQSNWDELNAFVEKCVTVYGEEAK